MIESHCPNAVWMESEETVVAFPSESVIGLDLG